MEFGKVELQDRTYIYPPSGDRVQEYKVTIRNVVSINVSESGTHRLNTREGDKHIILPGFLHIKFNADEWTF